MDSQVLADMVEVLLESREDYRPHQVIVLRNGEIVLNLTFHPFSHGSRHSIASIGKTITSTLIGIAIDQGFIASVDEPVLSFFPGWAIANRDERKESMTIAHLLAQRSGIYHGDDGSHAAEDAAMTASPDWIQWILDQPMASEPGGEYYYSNANLHLASGVLVQATGMTPREFAQEYLYGPLRITYAIWPEDPQGINYGHGGQVLLPHDLAKIGVLFLRGGQWMGEQVVSTEWVNLATSGYPGPPPPGWSPEWSFGFAWAVNSQQGFVETAGSGGQVMRLVRDDDLVLMSAAGGGSAYNACGRNGAIINDVLNDYVTRSILSSSALAPNPQGVARLASLIDEAALAADGSPQPVPPLPAVADSISGVRFVLEANPVPLDWVTLTFPGGSEAILEYQTTEPISISVGLDGVPRVSPGESGLPEAAKGWWEDDSRFVILLDRPALYGYLRAELVYEGDDVTITLHDLACGEPAVTLSGHIQR